MDPINYMLDVKNPIEEAIKGYTMGRNEIAQRQDMQIQQQNAAQQQQLFEMQKAAADKAVADAQAGQAELARIAQLGAAATADDYMKAWVANPAIRDDLNSLKTMMTEPQSNALLQTTQNLYASAASGNVDATRNMLQLQLDAAANSKDQTMVPGLKAAIEQLDQDPQGAMAQLKTTAAMTLMGLRGPEYIKTINESLGQKPTDAMRTQDAQLRAAGILPKSEGGDGSYEAAMAKAGGVAGPEKVDLFDIESKLRGEYTNLTKDVRAIEQSYNRLQSVENTGAGDIALVYSYMKMLDPGSVVREGEFATAQNSAGIPTKVVDAYNKALSGKFLSEDQRAKFKSQATALLTAAKKSETAAISSLMPIVKKYGADPANVFGTSAPAPEVDDVAFTSAMQEKMDKGETFTPAEIDRLNAIAAKGQ